MNNFEIFVDFFLFFLKFFFWIQKNIKAVVSVGFPHLRSSARLLLNMAGLIFFVIMMMVCV